MDKVYYYSIMTNEDIDKSWSGVDNEVIFAAINSYDDVWKLSDDEIE